MICKCPNCGNAITYSIEDRSLTCSSCGSSFSTGSVVNEELWEQLETMECDIYRCTTCSAEITVNDVEAATFCGYCGQPTIVFNRISSQIRPEYIIPFSITKDEAEKRIRKHFKKSIFTKNSIKNFETERIVGIYIPYWLFDIDYSSKQTIKGDVGSGKSKRTYNYYRECECNLKNLTIDASKNLCNSSSERLEPYDFSQLKKFDIGFLSGFYADSFDVTSEEATKDAVYKAKALYDSEVLKTIAASNKRMIIDKPCHLVNSASYAMLPAWFLSFTDEDNTCYTILVNGQTGKVVGAVPFIKSKVETSILTLGSILSIPCIFITMSMFNNILKDTINSLIILLFADISLFAFGLKYFVKLKESVELTTAKLTNIFVKERQDN